MLILGIIIGLLIAVLILALEIRLVKENKPIIKVISEKVSKKQEGAIFIPDEEEEARKELIEQNEKQGKTTYLRDL